ncbi:MAG: hypothetical protein M3292_02015 [Actinomycetota bacterium]|nr:hypothetical protein [Actinomycetota bacterium]
MATATRWAVLLCKFNDNDSEPLPRSFYERLFTTAGAGSRNMTDYFSDASHGALDLSGNRVFGWFTLPKAHSEYTGSGANPAGRQELVDWARQAAADHNEDLSPFFGVVVVTNVDTDLWGGGGEAVCGPSSLQPSVLGQEMGHGYGLDHSRVDGSLDDYTDPWDTMSTWNSCYMASHPEYTLIGPGLNAANMRGRGWLDESRVFRRDASEFETSVVLRPLHRRDLAGWLAAELPGPFLAEFRMNEGWDAAIPRPAVLVHRFEANHSYLMRGEAGQLDLGPDEGFSKELIGAVGGVSVGVAVEAIDPGARTATIRIFSRVTWHVPRLVATILGGVAVDAGGWMILNGKIHKIPPRGPVTRILEQAMLYQSSQLELAAQSTRDQVRRGALDAIASELESLREEVAPFRSPPPIQERGQA